MYVNPKLNQRNVIQKKKKINGIVDKLMNRELLTDLVRNLDKHNLSKDFFFLVKSMAEGNLPVDTIPHLAHLETVRFHQIKDSRRMWYSKKMKKIWHCFYKVGGGPPLRLLSGPKGAGNMNYKPSSCNINFAVPSANTIRAVDTSESAKFLPPSIFHPVIRKISQSIGNKLKEFILSYDGKSVGTGLKGDNYGDVDLWGFEYEPNLKLAEERLEKENEIIMQFGSDFRQGKYSECQNSMEDLFAIITSRIKDIRKIVDKCRKTELKYKKADLENPKYKEKHQYTIQNAQYLSDNCRAIMHRALNVNCDLCNISAHINQTQKLINHTGIVHFHEQPNLKILMDPHDISDFFEECDDTVFVKQRTEIWKRTRDMCAVTGSTLHKAIGLGTLQQQKDHFDQKFKGKQEPEVSEEVKKMMDYGTENEVLFSFILLSFAEFGIN